MTKKECFYGIYPIKFIWRGNCSDPLISYKKHTFNYWDIERFFYDVWIEENNKETFENWISKNGKRVKEHLNYIIDMENE